MRAGRLLALLMELQTRRRATAAELAAELEVSVRTIYRDVAALQGAGVPLWTETGPNGGIRLIDGWRTDLDGLTGDEAMALALAGAPEVAGDLGLGAVLVAAETKVRAALPPELRSRSQRVRERFHLDAPGWFHRADDTTRLGPLAEAVWASRRVRIDYARADATVRRTVDPLGLVMKAGTWYLVARHRRDIRTYRVGRIDSLEALPDTFDRPDGFDLAAHWRDSRGDFERSLRRFTCRLRLSPAGVRKLPIAVDPVAAAEAIRGAEQPAEDGWRVVVLEAESEAVALDQLTALGAAVEVLDPPSLRSSLAEAGRSVAALNSQ